MAGHPPLRFKLPHEFFPPKPQEHNHPLEDDYDDHISDVSSHCCYCSSNCSLRFKPHESFPPKPQEHNHLMVDDYDDHISDNSSHSCSCCSNCSSDGLDMKVDHLRYSKRSNSSMVAQAPGSPHQSDPAEDQLLHTTATDYDYDYWSAYVQLHDHSSQHSHYESEGGYNSYKLRSPSHSSIAVEGATTPYSYQTENDSDSDDSCFSLPSCQYSSPLPTTPCHDPESYYGPFSPTNSPTAATPPLYYDCNRCFEMAKKPVVTSCGHVYCSVCLYEWLNCDNVRECVVCMTNLYDSFITPIRSGIKSGFEVRLRTSQKEHRD